MFLCYYMLCAQVMNSIDSRLSMNDMDGWTFRFWKSDLIWTCSPFVGNTIIYILSCTIVYKYTVFITVNCSNYFKLYNSLQLFFRL